MTDLQTPGLLPDGWVLFKPDPQNLAARKWFHDHYKTMQVDKELSGYNGLAAACAEVERELALREQHRIAALEQQASELDEEAARLRASVGGEQNA